MQFCHESAPTKVLGASCKNCTLYFNSCHFQKVFHHHVYLPYQNWTQLLHPANCQREEINFNRNCTFWHWVYTHPKRVICKISHPLIKNILIWTVCHMLYFSMWHICYAYKQYGSQTQISPCQSVHPIHYTELSNFCNSTNKISSKQPKSYLLLTFRPLSEAFIRRSWY